MSERDAILRAHDFLEVNEGYDLARASFESERCLRCQDEPCIDGCPVRIPIPDFLHAIAMGDMPGAAKILRTANPLPAICGRVCPQETQCEATCHMATRFFPVGVGHLERFVSDWEREQPLGEAPAAPWRTARVAVIGSGPAGLVCAGELARMGYPVTVYEGLHAPGGVLRYGIPEFRLPDTVIDAEMENVTRLGVKIECNTLVGRLFTIEQMIEEMGYDAVFIGTGAGTPYFMDIPGESLNGVLSANELLTRCNLMHAGEFPDYDTPLHLGRSVAVIGSGNTAMDAMRVCLRLGAEKVYCVYRRTKTESPARAEEIDHAEEEGVDFRWLTAPIEILGDDGGNVRGMRCVEMELGEPDSSGRRRPVPIADSEYDFEVDMVVYAIGTQANPIIGQTSKLKLNDRGYIEVDENLATSMAGVYAGGDIVTGGATVILAMGAGRRAARSMKAYFGIRDSEVVYGGAEERGDGALFGIEPVEKNFTRLRLA
jgi:glutamate synthase (NADPH/NADH) small chain